MNAPQPSIRESLSTLPQAVWILFFGIFLNKLGSFVIPFLAVILTERGFSAAEAGLAVSAYGAGNLAAALLGGHLADSWGRRATIVWSMFSVAVAMLCLSQTEGLAATVVWAAAAGLTGEFYRPASSAMLTDLAPAAHRVPAFAAYRVAFNAGWACGPVIAGLLAHHSSLWLFVGDAVTSVLFGLVAWRALPAGNPQRETQTERLRFWPALRADRPFQQVLLATLLVGLVYVQIVGAFGLAIHRCGIPSTTYGLLMGLNGLLVVLGELPMTTWTRRIPARRAMALGYALTGIGFGGVAWAHTPSGFALAVFVFTLGEIIAMPVSIAYVASLTPEHLRGRYLGVYGLTWSLALTFGPGLGTLLFARHSAALWFGAALLGGLAAAVISWPSPAPHRARAG